MGDVIDLYNAVLELNEKIQFLYGKLVEKNIIEEPKDEKQQQPSKGEAK